nr:hypothetical protein [uncultured Halomonas sp.]
MRNMLNPQLLQSRIGHLLRHRRKLDLIVAFITLAVAAYYTFAAALMSGSVTAMLFWLSMTSLSFLLYHLDLGGRFQAWAQSRVASRARRR